MKSVQSEPDSKLSQDATLLAKILFVIPGDEKDRDTGSSMIFARRQAEELRRHGLDVDIFFLLSRTAPWTLLREFSRFRQVIRGSSPNVIHAHFGTVTGLFTVLATRLLSIVASLRQRASIGRIPIVITYRGSDLNHVPTAGGPRAWMGRIFSQVAALGAARIVCVSEGLRGHLWWRQELATVLPSGVDLNRFHPGSKHEARERLGWSSHRPVVLFNAGHDPRNKRLDLAQSAVALVKGRIPALEFKLMQGEVPPDQVPDWMNAADCLLLTSDAEGSPTVVQEALACALPIVSVDTGDVVERLAGVEGTRVCSRDPIALANAMHELLNPPRRSEGATRALEVDSTRIAKQLCCIYRACMDDSPTRDPQTASMTRPPGL